MSTEKISALSWMDMTPWEVREKLNSRIMALEVPTHPVWSVANRTIQQDARSTPVRIYSPNSSNDLPIILLIHGGAWVAGNLDTHDNLARYLCSQAEAIVVSVDYVNAPEGKFPLQLEQCYDALEWIIDHANAFSADPSKLAVVGDSAGGNMGAALSLLTRDKQGPKIDLQVLINPAPDLSCNGTLERQNDPLDILRWQAVQYLSDPRDASNFYVSPLLADDLSNLPAAVVLLAEYDDLREAGEKYAERLKASGVPTLVYCQLGIGHLADHGARVSSRAKESLDVAVDALKSAFSKEKN